MVRRGLGWEEAALIVCIVVFCDVLEEGKTQEVVEKKSLMEVHGPWKSMEVLLEVT